MFNAILIRLNENRNIEIMMKSISVLMVITKGNKANDIEISLNSILNQTQRPNQIVIVQNGEIEEDALFTLEALREQNSLIEIYKSENFESENKALAFGLQYCKGDYITICDCGSVSVQTRFEELVKQFETNSGLSVVSSNYAIKGLDKEKEIKQGISTHVEIIKKLKKTNALNKFTMLIKREILLKAGGFLDWDYLDDWYLLIRLYLANAKFCNIQKRLLTIESENKKKSKPKKFEIFKSVKNLLKFMKTNKVINFFEYLLYLIEYFVKVMIK